MATEIELKAWVYDPEAAALRIGSFARELGRHLKVDEYWRPLWKKGRKKEAALNLGSGVRIRREGTSAVVTYKQKEVRNGIEINDEREFSVSDADAMGGLLSRLGLSIWIRKRKEGRAWNWDGMLIELSHVEGLGWFVELELLAESDNPSTVESARRRLMDGLSRCGIAEDRLEVRYYTEMLEALRVGTFIHPDSPAPLRSRP